MKMKLNKNTFIVITTAALFIQILIITYNHFSGLIYVTGITNFIVRISAGTIFSSIFGLIIVYIDLQIRNILDKYFPLPEKLYLRIPAEIIAAMSAGILVGALLTVISNIIFPYSDGLKVNIIKNALIVSVLNLIISITIEAVIWFKRNQESKLLAEMLEKENTIIRFETLKNQLNPHFLFNSLNVLSSLIKKDSDKAQKFIDEFSIIYRYTLDVIDKTVVELKEEVEFVKAYFYLQKIRFDDSFHFEIKIAAEKLHYFVPPLALQTLLENIFKHNRASADSPLKIKIYTDNNFIIVLNNIQPKFSNELSKKIGLQNLKNRYKLICGIEPEFIINEKEYIAKIALIIPD